MISYEMIVALMSAALPSLCRRGRVAVLPEYRVSASADLPRCLAALLRGYCLNVITIAGGGDGESYDRRRGRKEYAGVFRRRSQLLRARRPRAAKIAKFHRGFPAKPDLFSRRPAMGSLSLSLSLSLCLSLCAPRYIARRPFNSVRATPGGGAPRRYHRRRPKG